MASEKLPAQLTWREFLSVLEQLGYKQLKSKGGSARSFHNPHREPPTVTFHEPHGKNPLREGTLRLYLRILRLDRERFLELLRRD